jgi:hypothetical protein
MAIFTKADYSRGIVLRSRSTRAPIALDGWALEMVFKANRADTEVLLTLSTANGGLALDPTKTGRLVITMTRDQVDALGAGNRAFALYRKDSGNCTRLMSGRAMIREGV